MKQNVSVLMFNLYKMLYMSIYSSRGRVYQGGYQGGYQGENRGNYDTILKEKIKERMILLTPINTQQNPYGHLTQDFHPIKAQE